MSKIKISAGILFFAILSFHSLAVDSLKPDKPEGFNVRTLHVTNLKGEIPHGEGISLRMRLISIEPGGHTSFHVHKNRPGIVYVVSGSIINHPEGEPPVKVASGEIFVETQGYTHYIENKGETAAILVASDIVTDTEKPK